MNTRKGTRKSSQGAKVRPCVQNMCIFNEFIWPEFSEEDEAVDLDNILDMYNEVPLVAAKNYTYAINGIQKQIKKWEKEDDD